ncbi:MAG: hypothetical protein FT671_02290 [Pantoea sp. Brub]|nr:hypothetical protein [Pantoea sp. Brub]
MLDMKTNKVYTETLLAEKFSYPYISWSAIFTGVIFNLSINLFLSILGIAIGATTISPIKYTEPLYNISISALIWITTNILISISIGSYIAGYLSKYQGSLHGLLVFSLSTFLSLWLTFIFTSNSIGNYVHMINSSVQCLSKKNINHDLLIHQITKNNFKDINLNLNNLKTNLENELNLNNHIIVNIEKDISNKTLSNSNNTDINHYANNKIVNVTHWLTQLINKHNKTLTYNDINELKHILKTYSNKNDYEINIIVNRIQNIYIKAIQEYNKLKKQNQNKIKQIADQTVKLTSKVSWFTVLFLIIEAVVASLMGKCGCKNNLSRIIKCKYI